MSASLKKDGYELILAQTETILQIITYVESLDNDNSNAPEELQQVIAEASVHTRQKAEKVIAEEHNKLVKLIGAI